MNHCARCGTVTYCSRACQSAHWPQHKLHCEAPPVGTRPEINTACDAYYEAVPVNYPAEEYSDFDKAVMHLVLEGDLMSIPYRFVARATVCRDWLVGEVHLGDRSTIASAVAVRAGRWLFALERDPRSDSGALLITVFMGKMHGKLVAVDALPSGVSHAFTLLAWMVKTLAPLLGRDEAEFKPRYEQLDPVILYEFTPVFLPASAGCGENIQ